jgi:tetratricopeptide (TPR) repeat protein
VALFNDWGLALDRLGRPLEAEKHFRRAIDISRAGDTEETVSPILLNNYAKTLDQLGRLNEAADYAERAYAKAMLVDNQLAISQSLYVRALIYLDQHDATRAAAMLAQVEPRWRRSLPAGSYWFGALVSAQAILAKNRGNLEPASRLSDEAVAIVEAAIKTGEQGSDFLPIALLRRSAVRLETGQYDDAAADATHALNLLQVGMQPGSFSAYVGRAYLSLGRALQAQGKHIEARAAFQSAANHLKNGLGRDHPDTRGALLLAAAN